MMKIPRDIVPGLLLLGLCAVLWYATTNFETDPLGMGSGMPATEMPRLVLAVIALLSLIMIGQGIVSGEASIFQPIPWRMPATAVFLGGIALFFTTLGLPVAFFLVCFLLPILWGVRASGNLLIFALGVPVVIYVLFQILLSVRLPLGPLQTLGA